MHDFLVDGYIIRFTGVKFNDPVCTEAWNTLREKLKRAAYATWYASYMFPDGKRGGWFIEKPALYSLRDSFTNLEKKLNEANQQKQEKRERQEYSSYAGQGVYIPQDIKDALVLLCLPISSLPSEDEIKSQYKKLALKYHPDLGGDIERMKKINNANDVVRKFIGL